MSARTGADAVRQAADTTRDICQHAAMAVAALDKRDRNGFGVLVAPLAYLRALRAAKDEIEKAIALHTSIQWPTAQDYDQL